MGQYIPGKRNSKYKESQIGAEAIKRAVFIIEKSLHIFS